MNVIAFNCTLSNAALLVIQCIQLLPLSSLDSPDNLPTRLDAFLSSQASIGVRRDARVTRPRLVSRRLWAPRQSLVSVQADWFSHLSSWLPPRLACVVQYSWVRHGIRVYYRLRQLVSPGRRAGSRSRGGTGVSASRNSDDDGGGWSICTCLSRTCRRWRIFVYHARAPTLTAEAITHSRSSQQNETRVIQLIIVAVRSATTVIIYVWKN